MNFARSYYFSSLYGESKRSLIGFPFLAVTIAKLDPDVMIRIRECSNTMPAWPGA